ncbi:tRNA (guanosine(46)-N7)-methyltransferase TrmB [Limnobacter litoralis]|uniref:tRNA (guanine-N(7)-)-methyltransferase n=2 Tax=Limnobacter TaxID=131079 RepID=A0ABQ5YNC7_9BURK|nr:tRNA (guanosine(46)-N7)-methyltransferase TrmB [Limnobacter litoralis]GLR24952.1 tRNA (guanine-N(7)-)-methyltransferase [Limnobacter litoralis]
MNSESHQPAPLLTEEDFRQKHIRSFVKRRGHISKAQERAVEQGMPVWGIQYSATEPIQFETRFGRQADNWLEIGFGMGETTAKIAKAHPEVNYLGVEIYTAGVGSLLKKIGEEDIHNIRIISHDVVEVLRDMIPDSSLSRVLIYFPDPWRKARHHKRRLIQPEFISHLCKKLKPGAILHCATDWENYAMHMLEVLQGEPLLKNTASGFAPRPDTRPLTKFENRGLRLGHGVWDLVFERVSS